MPLTDSYGQNVAYPTLTDKPNAQTLGQGIVEGLTPKSVMNFASAVVRGATITSPKAGMVTWLSDVGRLEVYDGTAWVTVAAGTSTWKTVALVSGFTHDGNDNGTVQYRVVNLFGEQTIMFRGGLGCQYTGTGGGIANNGVFNSVALPVEARPSNRRTIAVACSVASSARATIKLDINTNGNLGIVGTNTSDTKPPWVSLNGTFASL